VLERKCKLFNSNDLLSAFLILDHLGLCQGVDQRMSLFETVVPLHFGEYGVNVILRSAPKEKFIKAKKPQARLRKFALMERA
jgi:hypothetical protein